VGPRAGLDSVEKRKFLIQQRLELRLLGRSARSQWLYRLSYPGSLAPCYISKSLRTKCIPWSNTILICSVVNTRMQLSNQMSWQKGTNHASCFRHSGFKCQPRHRIYCSSRCLLQCRHETRWESYIEIGHERILPYPTQFIVQKQSFCSTLHKLGNWKGVVK
jgi:hypothetical protein